MLEMSAGVLLFSGVFLVTDPVTAPRHWLARILYGALAAVFVMVLRHFGRFECVAYFGILPGKRPVPRFGPVLLGRRLSREGTLANPERRRADMNRTRTSSGFRRLGGIFLDTFFAKNIVLVQAVGLCPIIAIGINLKYGVALTLCTAAVLLPTSLCMSLWGSRPACVAASARFIRWAPRSCCWARRRW